MKANPVNIAAWAKFLRFETFQDPQLIAMLEAGARFIRDVIDRKHPRWLTLCGTSGAGKTYLAEKIWNWYRNSDRYRAFRPEHGEIIYPGQSVYWPELSSELRSNRGRDWVGSLATERLVVLDDIGSAHDSTGYSTGELANLLGRRVDKWTIITCNLSVEQIGQRIDPRVASRVLRNGSIVVDVEVLDYALRGK